MPWNKRRRRRPAPLYLYPTRGWDPRINDLQVRLNRLETWRYGQERAQRARRELKRQPEVRLRLPSPYPRLRRWY
jgi:hypothetical protein